MFRSWINWGSGFPAKRPSRRLCPIVQLLLLLLNDNDETENPLRPVSGNGQLNELTMRFLERLVSEFIPPSDPPGLARTPRKQSPDSRTRTSAWHVNRSRKRRLSEGRVRFVCVFVKWMTFSSPPFSYVDAYHCRSTHCVPALHCLSFPKQSNAKVPAKTMDPTSCMLVSN